MAAQTIPIMVYVTTREWEAIKREGKPGASNSNLARAKMGLGELTHGRPRKETRGKDSPSGDADNGRRRKSSSTIPKPPQPDVPETDGGQGGEDKQKTVAPPPAVTGRRPRVDGPILKPSEQRRTR